MIAEVLIKNVFVSDKLPENAYRGGEGSDAKLEPGKSLVYSAMEVCLCCLVRQIPQVNPAVARSKSGLWAQRKYQRLAPEAHHLIVRSLQSMIRLPNLCSQEGFKKNLISMIRIFCQFFSLETLFINFASIVIRAID